MSITVGFINSESQINIKELDTDNQQVASKLVDTIELKDYPFNLLFTADEDDLTVLEKTLKEEEKYYPIVSANQLGLDKEMFQELSYEELIDTYAKVNARWILNNNIATIEQSFGLITYLKDLYINDRDNFFEELWFLLKTNLATNDLCIIFHDLKETSSKQKNDKPQLSYSFISGTKIPNIQPAADKENLLMQEYQNEFGDIFNVTEFNSARGHLVASAKIGLSPVLIMAKLNTFNQLQQSILIAIFSGLQPA